jgi:predicted peptidase
MCEETSVINGMQYYIRYPAGYQTGEKYPVILFLHGAGTRGSDMKVLKENSFFRLTAALPEFPFVAVAALREEGTWFERFETLMELVRFILGNPFADRNRIYLMGPSMGGYGTWQLAMSMPEYFAAICPICGGGMYWNAERLRDVPVWAFHGAKDVVVRLEESVKMTEAVNACGGNARLTVYPQREHDAWTDTYSNPEVFRWLLSCVKGTE